MWKLWWSGHLQITTMYCSNFGFELAKSSTEIIFVWIRRLADFKRKNIVAGCSCNGQTQTTRHCRWDNYPAKESSMSDTKRLHILLAFLYSSTAIPCDFLEKFLALKLEFLLKLRETNRWAWTVYVIATIPNWTQPVSLQKLHLSSVKDGLHNVIFQQCGCEKADDRWIRTDLIEGLHSLILSRPGNCTCTCRTF